MDIECLPRIVRIDWLRFQVTSYYSIMRLAERIFGLPFEKREQTTDTRDALILNKVWHDVYEFQGSLIGVRHPPTSIGGPADYFVDFNGSFFSCISLDKVAEFLAFSRMEEKFIGNRIDIALDFPVASPRLSHRFWEGFLADNLLYTFQSSRRISNSGRNIKKRGTTVYLGSRESEIFVRIYDKNIDGVDYDRLEIEFKRSRADSIIEEIVAVPISDLPRLLNGIVCNVIAFKRSSPEVDFFESYKVGPIALPSPSLELDIHRSIAFVERHAPTLAMIEEFMGSDCFDDFMRSTLAAGRLKMKSRHRIMIKNAKFLGATVLALFLIFAQTSGAIAGGLTCPAPVPLSFQFAQKFPIDIVNPTPAEQAYFNNVGDGCFQINSGLNFDRICLPGMIVNALKPFVIMGLGIKFIFSD